MWFAPILTLALCATASTAVAQCAAGMQTFLTCTLDNGQKTLAVCFDDTEITYRYGAIDAAAELALSVGLRDADYTPWPGVSATIWESVTFHNQTFALEVFGAITRIYPEDENAEMLREISGGIIITSQGEALATLTCDPATTTFTYSDRLERAKRTSGQCWDHASHSWQTCP